MLRLAVALLLPVALATSVRNGNLLTRAVIAACIDPVGDRVSCFVRSGSSKGRAPLNNGSDLLVQVDVGGQRPEIAAGLNHGHFGLGKTALM